MEEMKVNQQFNVRNSKKLKDEENHLNDLNENESDYEIKITPN